MSMECEQDVSRKIGTCLTNNPGASTTAMDIEHRSPIIEV
jgi:hypothetical protein